MTKRIETVLSSPGTHWVGDGFPVSSVFSPQTVDTRLSPYILFDYAAPTRFDPARRARGVGSHPHRGFETVTVVYQGSLEHRDSAGNSGSIGPGDVQWMTAGSGVLHEEMHSREFTQRGGQMEMAQLWVNLPAKHKMTRPRYQELRGSKIPTVELPAGGGSVRVIAGDYEGTPGAAHTVTPVVLWDVILAKGTEAVLPVAIGHNAALFVRSGSIRADGQAVGPRQLAILEREGHGIAVFAEQASALLVIGGAPIHEPVVAYGPFVMNTEQEIELAIADTQSGRLGRLK